MQDLKERYFFLAEGHSKTKEAKINCDNICSQPISQRY